MALYIDDFVNPPFVPVSEADDRGIYKNPARVRSRNREETCVVERLDQLRKPLRGDEVVLFGPGGDGEPTAQEWGETLSTISYEIVTGIGDRVPRSYP